MEIKGVFVSHWRGRINWPEVRRDGYRYAFIKASDGASFVDPRYEYNYAEARRTGLVVGSVHYYRLGVDPFIQFQHFRNTAQPGNLPGVLDVEDFPWLRTRRVVQDALVWGKLYQEHYRRKPLLYTNLNHLRWMRRWTKELNQVYSLWIAIWRDWQWGLPEIPGWEPLFWQWSDLRPVRGIPTGACQDLWLGTEDQFITYAGLGEQARLFMDLSEHQRWLMVMQLLQTHGLVDDGGRLIE